MILSRIRRNICTNSSDSQRAMNLRHVRKVPDLLAEQRLLPQVDQLRDVFAFFWEVEIRPLLRSVDFCFVHLPVEQQQDQLG